MANDNFSGTLQAFYKKPGLKLNNSRNSLNDNQKNIIETKYGRNNKMAAPLKKYRCGQIEAAVWDNEKEYNGNLVNFKTVSLRKSWLDKDNVWRDATINLRRNDLQKAILVLQKAQEELLLQHENVVEDEEDD